MVFHGMLRAHNEGQKVRFMTLTENPANPLTVRDLSAAWNRLRTRLKNAELLDQYAAVVETTKRGRPHLHVVFTGSFVPQRRLSQMAEQVGFGRVADIRLVSFNPDDQEDQAAKNTAMYVAKELSGYVSKAGGDAAGKLVAYRRRPLRTSRGWFPGGMAVAKRRLLAEIAERTDWEPDPGGFFFVANNPETGTLRIQGSTPSGETFTLADRADADGPVERSQASRSEDERQETSVSSATHPRKRHKRGLEREKRAGLSSGRALSRHERKRSKQRRDTRRRRERPETEVQAGAEARAGPTEEER